MTNRHSTMELLTALKTRLSALTHPTIEGELLFEKVEYYDSELIGKAMKDLTIIKQRVCFIVPENDTFEVETEGRSKSIRFHTQFMLLLADRSWTKGGQEANFGGVKNLGVVAMKDEVIDRLLESPTLDLTHVELEPISGNFLELTDDKKDSPGRECYAAGWTTPMGYSRYSF